MVKTELALIAEVGDASEVCGAEPFGLTVYCIGIKTSKKIVERGAEVVAATAPVADIEDALQLTLDLRFIPERFAIEVKSHWQRSGIRAGRSQP